MRIAVAVLAVVVFVLAGVLLAANPPPSEQQKNAVAVCHYETPSNDWLSEDYCYVATLN